MIGKVKFFNPKRGYGFIIGEGNKEFFVHFSAIKEDGTRILKSADEVEFEEGFDRKGPIAINVKRLVK